MPTSISKYQWSQMTNKEKIAFYKEGLWDFPEEHPDRIKTEEIIKRLEQDGTKIC